jgi:hypothetical protein
MARCSEVGGAGSVARAEEHSPTSATGTAWEHTPWQATQRAAWVALKNAGGG